jgi:hypothetical protein
VSVQEPHLRSSRSIGAIDSPLVTFTTPSESSHELRLKIEVEQLRQELDDARDVVSRQSEQIKGLQSKAIRYRSERNAARDHNTVLEGRSTALGEQLQSSEQQRLQQSADLQRYTSHITVQEQQIRSLVVERDEALTKRLSMDEFDSSVDRVSEGDLVSQVRNVNALIDDLVLAIQDHLAPFLPLDPSDTILMEDRPQLLLRAFMHTRPGDENWGLLMEVLLHHLVVTWLQSQVFAFSVTPASTKDLECLEDVYEIITSTGECISISNSLNLIGSRTVESIAALALNHRSCHVRYV